MEIKIVKVSCGYIWRMWIPDLIRPVCDSYMVCPRYDSAVKDAIRFRRNVGSSLGNISISYKTPSGKKKVIQESLMTRKGQLVDRSKSKGLGVCETWVTLFEKNENNFKAGKLNKVMIDEQITEAMFKAFPDRKSSGILSLTNKVRGRYNRGVLTKGKKPKIKSCQYVKNGKDKLTQMKGKV